MRVAVIQSNYVPWRGYFDIIDSVDLFVFHDDLQYTKNDWRNRNRIVSPRGLQWMTVPVHYRSVSMRIDEVPIDYAQNWPARHCRQLEANYRCAPFFRDYIDGFSEIVGRRFASISELNVSVCRWVMEVLNIRTPTLLSSELSLSGTKTERLVDLLTKVGGTSYLSGPSAAAYLQPELFAQRGIEVEYKGYRYPDYPQLHGRRHGDATILDLMFNTGPDARRYLKSLAPDYTAAPAERHAQCV